MGEKKKTSKTCRKEGIEIKTTHYILRERETCICPCLGNAHHRSDEVQKIKTNMALFFIRKAIQLRKTRLDLMGCSICTPPFSSIARKDELLSNILHLDLSKNSLFHLEQLISDLCILKKLKKINLSKNHLSGKLSDKVKTFTELEEIWLDQNNILELHSNCRYWTKIKHFSASHNELKNIPDDLDTWEKIETFNLRNNQLENIPTCVSKWQKLKKLFLGRNKLKTIPNAIGNISPLEEIDMKSNQLEFIPDTLENCSALVYLNVGDNRIHTLPNMEKWTNLKELHIYRNKMKDIPESLKDLIHLKRLSISNNQIKTVPEEIGDLICLEELYLNYNSLLSTLPHSIGNLKCLSELSMRGCVKVKGLPLSLAKCYNLRELDLRSCGRKETCKLHVELVEELNKTNCIIRGGIQKNTKKRGKGKKKSKK